MWILIYIHISKNRGGGEYIYCPPIFFQGGAKDILPPYICSGGAAPPLAPLFRRPYTAPLL